MFDAVNDRANESTVEAVTNGVSYGKLLKQQVKKMMVLNLMNS